MATQSLAWSLALIGVFLVTGCGKEEAAAESPKYDPKFIASEADKGNLVPLSELNAACTAEIAKHAKRLSACAAQDEVRKLAKPINIRF